MIYITAIHLEGGSAHQHIASVRWINSVDGVSKTSSRTDMVTFIEAKNAVKVGGENGPVSVGVVNGTSKYLRTYADDEWTNNLLSLPRF